MEFYKRKCNDLDWIDGVSIRETEELKKRKVFRVAASYAVVAFIIFQLVEILFPIFNFPQWTQQFIVIIILLGFPIAVIFSWIFDKTPEGFIKTTKKNRSC